MLRQALTLILAGLIVANVSSPVSVLAAREAGVAAPAAAGDISVASDPIGAQVFVDGVFAGQTPLTVRNVAAGDHRVRMAKDGYLENARVVNVDTGRSSSLQVKLTRQVGPQAARAAQVQVAVGPPTGGGGSKLPYLLAGLGGGFVGGFLYQKSKTSDTPATPANRAPAVSAVSASPSTGLMAATTISFSAAGVSDADGDTPTFSWSFGDGSTSTSATPSHVYATAGPFTVTVTIGDGKGGTASASTVVTIKSLTGTWAGPLSANLTYNTTLVLTQTGTSITGSYADQVPNNGSVTGAVSQTAPFVTFAVTVGASAPFSFNGTGVSATADTITGTTSGDPGLAGATWSLARQ